MHLSCRWIVDICRHFTIGVGKVSEERPLNFKLPNDNLQDGLKNLVEHDRRVHQPARLQEGVQANYLLLSVECVVELSHVVLADYATTQCRSFVIPEGYRLDNW